MIDLCGSWNKITSSQSSRQVFSIAEVQMTNFSVLKLTLGKLLSNSNTLLLFSLIWKKHMTLCGSTESSRIYMTRGLRGYLPTFISNFLQNRNFRVKFGDTFSEKIPQEMGAPQVQGLFLPFILGSGRYWIKSISTAKTWTIINKR